MIGTVRYWDIDDRSYSVAREVTGDILAETNLVTVDTDNQTVMVFAHNVIRIEIKKEP